MPANAKLALLTAETAEPPIARRDAPPEQPRQPERPVEMPSAPESQTSSAPDETPGREKTSRSVLEIVTHPYLSSPFCTPPSPTYRRTRTAKW